MAYINHNLLAANTARNLQTHYSRLALSTRRLSSGLRVNSAADDAAGLAIRELQRADIAALRQGSRNANDAISMIQVADGSLSVIDEKLIRMKELAEQAATGTYDSTQRLMIDSEYQAMASEITRIANATDFNGIKLLDGSLSGAHDGSGVAAKGSLKIHFGTGNDSAEDYYYVEIGDCTAKALGVGNSAIIRKPETETIRLCPNGKPVVATDTGYIDINKNFVIGPQLGEVLSPVYFDGHDRLCEHIDIYGNPDGTYWSLDQGGSNYVPQGPLENYMLEADGQKRQAYVNTFHSVYGIMFETEVCFDKDGNRFLLSESRLAEVETGAFTDGPADAYTVSTQEAAQRALAGINEAIVSKDKIRARLGALQNRLENTITNLNIQAENLQAAESRISDVDVASEMTEFVRNQILTQSATAMLGQANNLPQMLMSLIG